MLQLSVVLGIKNVFYASSSSVYNESKNTAFKENDETSNPMSSYGVTKKINELLADTYARQFGLTCIGGMRFFTVYDSWVRQDMAVWKFMNSVAENLNSKPYIISKPLPENELSYTQADISKLYNQTLWKPKPSLQEDTKEMTDWFLEYNRKNNL